MFSMCVVWIPKFDCLILNFVFVWNHLIAEPHLLMFKSPSLFVYKSHLWWTNAHLDCWNHHFFVQSCPSRNYMFDGWNPPIFDAEIIWNHLFWLMVWNINFIFPYIGNNHPNWLIFFREVQTTNRFWLMDKFQFCCYLSLPANRLGLISGCQPIIAWDRRTSLVDFTTAALTEEFFFLGGGYNAVLPMMLVAL